MNLPIIKKENRYRRSIVSFGGLNLLQSFSPGEMRECSGITHNAFPSVTQRMKSENVFECKSPTAVIFAGKECIASDGALYYDREKVGELSAGKKQLAALGDKIVVFPDKVCYDTQTKTFSDLRAFCETDGVSVTFTSNKISVPENSYKESSVEEVCSFSKDFEVVAYESVSVKSGNVVLNGFSFKLPAELTEGTVITEKCEKNQYRVVEGVTASDEICEVQCTLVTVKNITGDLFKELKEGDIVEISGCINFPENNLSAEILSKTESSITFSEEIFVAGTETDSIIIQRKIPDFTSICSYENRLWGCEGNTIYASALGDVTNFFRYKDLSTDSFTVKSNSAGDFTACISYGNCCLFFKENSCYKLYGNRPSNFQLSESFGGGILKEDSGSIVNSGGKLIYKGAGGIYVFYGGMPVCISEKLGNISMKNAVSGSDGKIYYLSADTKEGREEFVWDIEKNLWCKSGVADTIGYANYGGNMFRLKNSGIEKIGDEPDKDTEWSITLCPFDEDWHLTKNYSRLHICAELFEGSHIRVEVKSDDSQWRVVNTVYGDRKKYINIPCPVKSCHELQLRISGKGKSVLESVVREFSVN